MFNITLICTVHYEQGKCNPMELCRIIEHIKPDIIFEELSKANFHYFYDEQRPANLETNAKEIIKLIRIAWKKLFKFTCMKIIPVTLLSALALSAMDQTTHESITKGDNIILFSSSEF